MTRVLRHSPADAALVVGALAHGALLIAAPSVPLVAAGLWWNANTVSHNFIHLPFFRSRAANVLFSAYSSVLLAFPQTLWRDRHLAHHAGRAWRMRWSRQLGVEVVLVALLWAFIASRGPELLATWIAGSTMGLLLCALHGRYEHAHGTSSHYGTLYNSLFFNDGYHVEHHTRPGEHWTRLPRLATSDARGSAWPAVLRWMEGINLEQLERLVLRWPLLQWFVVDRHRRALAKLVAAIPAARRITIIGGGLFPRTAVILRRLVPDAEITIVDRSRENLRIARRYFANRQTTPDTYSSIRTIEASYTRELCAGADLVVVPLSFDGDRGNLYEDPPAPAVAIHDWMWNVRGSGCLVSVVLLKRMNLVVRA